MLTTKTQVASFVAAVIAAQVCRTEPALAADPAPAPAPDATGTTTAPPNAGLEEIVIATTRYEATDLQLNSSNAVSVLSAKDLADTAVHNVAEALGLMPGVNVLNIATGAFIGGVDGAARAEG